MTFSHTLPRVHTPQAIAAYEEAARRHAATLHHASMDSNRSKQLLSQWKSKNDGRKCALQVPDSFSSSVDSTSGQSSLHPHHHGSMELRSASEPSAMGLNGSFDGSASVHQYMAKLATGASTTLPSNCSGITGGARIAMQSRPGSSQLVHIPEEALENYNSSPRTGMGEGAGGEGMAALNSAAHANWHLAAEKSAACRTNGNGAQWPTSTDHAGDRHVQAARPAADPLQELRRGQHGMRCHGELPGPGTLQGSARPGCDQHDRAQLTGKHHGQHLREHGGNHQSRGPPREQQACDPTPLHRRVMEVAVPGSWHRRCCWRCWWWSCREPEAIFLSSTTSTEDSESSESALEGSMDRKRANHVVTTTASMSTPPVITVNTQSTVSQEEQRLNPHCLSTIRGDAGGRRHLWKWRMWGQWWRRWWRRVVGSRSRRLPR